MWLAASPTLLEAGISGDTHLQPAALSICQSSLWGSFIHKQPPYFIWAPLSGYYRCKFCLWERCSSQEDLVLPARGSLFPGGCACSAQWHGTASSWRSSKVNSYNQGMWGILRVRKKVDRTNWNDFFFHRREKIRSESWAWGDCRLLSEEAEPFTSERVRQRLSIYRGRKRIT